MQVITEIHRVKGINTKGKTIHRTAVRAVIWRDGKLLMVYSGNVGDYKFPGGGVEVEETHEHALARELLEECDATLFNVIGELGAIVEYNFPVEKDFDVFKMTSYYYFCNIMDGSFVEQKLDGYESELGLTPAWVEVNQALHTNKSLLSLPDRAVWLPREIHVLEYLKQNFLKS